MKDIMAFPGRSRLRVECPITSSVKGEGRTGLAGGFKWLLIILKGVDNLNGERGYCRRILLSYMGNWRSVLGPGKLKIKT